MEDYVPYVSMDPLHDPKSFTFRLKVRQEGSKGSKLTIKPELPLIG